MKESIIKLGPKIGTEKELLEAFLNAESTAVKYLYENYFMVISSYITKNNGSVEDARNVFQEALLALYKQAKKKDFVLTTDLKTYLYSISRYQWLKTLRENKEEERFVEGFDLPNISSDLIINMEKAEIFRILQNILAKFNPNKRKILELYFQKYSTEEIALKLNLSKQYVKKKKHECKKQLFEYIKLDDRLKKLSNHFF